MAKKPSYYVYENMTFPISFPRENIISALKYQAKDDDLFIVSYPKCGSTWTQHIVYLILHNGEPLPKGKTIGSFIPFLEIDAPRLVEMSPPYVIKTHLSYDVMPKNPKAKYIYIIRNPKDCVTSFFHHTKAFLDAYNYTDGKFDDYFELFINGEIDWGDYFDYFNAWCPHVSDPNVLFLTYEKMKEDPKSHILKIAKFIDRKYYDLLTENNDILENIVCHSGASEMQKDDNRWNEVRRVENTFFVRKGVIGDWRNQLSEEQSKRIDDKIKEKFKGIDISLIWSDDILK